MVRESELLPSFGQDSIRYASKTAEDTRQDETAVEASREEQSKSENLQLSESSSESFFGLNPIDPDESYEEKVHLKDGTG